MTVPEAPFQHVLRLTDEIGIFEHAKGSVPRRHLGYCVDDVARALVVVSRQPDPSPAVSSVTSRYLEFVVRAQAPDGRCRNRFGLDRTWHDEPSLDDCWGRAVWGLGTAAARAADGEVRRFAAARFVQSARQRSPHSRSMVFAGLGAAEVLAVTPDDRVARELLAAVPLVIGRARPDGVWPWPEPRLTYANAAVAEVLIAAGEHLDDKRSLSDGLRLLGWLLDVETIGGHLSVTPVGGWTLGEARPGFDQQPIEVAAMADACARALRVTGDERWSIGLDRSINWFLGDNDAQCVMYDPQTGGGFDGLHRAGRNVNQGAESTLAMVATLQHARHLVHQ